MITHELLKQKILNVHNKEIEQRKEIDSLELEIFTHAIEFDTYEDLYKFINKLCKTREEFNLAMIYCREKFLVK